jgi:peptidoglycan/LPS O-acetylase OafA/YrhL
MDVAQTTIGPALSTAPTKADGNAHSNDIDLYRGVAAMLVAAMHTRLVTWIGMREFWSLHGFQLTPDALFGYATLPLAWGAIGVPVFFVLSGYCIHRPEAAKRARHGSFGLSPADFFARRFFRIYPVLLGALLVTWACDGWSRGFFPNSPHLGETGPRAFLVNLLSLQGVVGGWYGSNVALWTLAIEVQLYLFYPLLAMSLARWGGSATLLWVAAVTALSYYALERHGYRLFTSYWASWLLGALVAEAEAARLLSRLLSTPARRAACLGAGLALLSAGGALAATHDFAAFQIWAVAFALILLVTSSRPRAFGGALAALFRWLGTFSFSIYIVHMPIVVLIHSVCFNSERQPGLAPFVTTLLAAVGCAYLFSLLSERPALALSRRIKREGLGAVQRMKYFSMMRL